MHGVTASDLARMLDLSKARISQLTSQGKLDGAWSGTGALRRYDPAEAARLLNRRLDAGQMLGNGAKTAARIRDVIRQPDEVRPAPAPVPAQRDDAELRPGDDDRYTLARTQKAEEEARALRRRNAEAEGLFVLASEAGRQAAAQLGREIAEFEAVLRDAARLVADRMGVDAKQVRAILLEQWRGHRRGRVQALNAAAEAAPLTDEEEAQDI